MAEKTFRDSKQMVWIKLVIAIRAMVWEIEKTDIADFISDTYYRQVG